MQAHDPLDPYRALLGEAEFARLAAALEQPPLPAIRVNPLKIAPEAAQQTWPGWYGWRIRPVPFCAAGWQILAHDQPPGRTLEFENGLYYIQDAASMLPGEMFTPQDAPLILDLAAAPGGKTTHLVSRFEDRALIVANDTSDSRLAALRSNLQVWGALGVLITGQPGERFGRWFPETFDRVLLDAPCSGDTLRVSTGRRTRSVSDHERGGLCQRQDALLLSGFQALKPGGELVYSTCTLAPEEDEAILDGLLRRYPGTAVVEQIEHLPVAAPALSADAARTFDPQVSRAIRLWPHLYQTSGFFAARIRKTGAVPVDHEPPPERPWAKTGLAAVARSDAARLVDQVRQSYGFDLEPVLAAQGLSLRDKERIVYTVPERALSLFADFPQRAAGFLLGQWMEDQFVPSHELVTRFDSQFSRRRVQLAPDHITRWRAGHDLRDLPDLPYAPGTVILLEDERGRFLGRGKVQRDRLRNLLPRRLKV